jgi:hypothetical protein
MLNADVPEGVDVKFGSSDPAEPFAEGVVGIHDVPMAGGVGNGHGAFAPVVVPLWNLHEGQGRKQKTEDMDHWALGKFSIILAYFLL